MDKYDDELYVHFDSEDEERNTTEMESSLMPGRK